MVNVFFFGKKYEVPGDMTIMTAMEYAGYTLSRGCGCRHGFCGACATIYRIKGDNTLKTCLACQKQVEDGMYVASIPFFPTDKRTYDINDIKPNQQIMMELYPETVHLEKHISSDWFAGSSLQASAEFGRRYVSAIVDNMEKVLFFK